MIKFEKSIKGALASLCLLSSSAVFATSISYTLDANGGGNYTYNYTVDNTAGPDINGFAIDFDETLYDEFNLTVVDPASWFGVVIGSFAPFDPAQVDWAHGDPSTPTVFATGSTASGFSVTFDWLGAAGGPGVQDFYTYDANFADLDAGVTTLDNSGPGPGPVPAPGALIMLGLGIVGLALQKKSKKG